MVTNHFSQLSYFPYDKTTLGCEDDGGRSLVYCSLMECEMRYHFSRHQTSDERRLEIKLHQYIEYFLSAISYRLLRSIVVVIVVNPRQQASNTQ